MPNLSLNFADLEPRQRHKLLCGLVVPRPIALVTTLSHDPRITDSGCKQLYAVEFVSATTRTDQ